jgi:hypothetical protein
MGAELFDMEGDTNVEERQQPGKCVLEGWAYRGMRNMGPERLCAYVDGSLTHTMQLCRFSSEHKQSSEV